MNGLISLMNFSKLYLFRNCLRKHKLKENSAADKIKWNLYYIAYTNQLISGL